MGEVIKSSNRFKARLTSQFPTTQLASLARDSQRILFKALLTSQFPTTQLATYNVSYSHSASRPDDPGAMICYVMGEGKWVVFAHC